MPAISQPKSLAGVSLEPPNSALTFIQHVRVLVVTLQDLLELHDLRENTTARVTGLLDASVVKHILVVDQKDKQLRAAFSSISHLSEKCLNGLTRVGRNLHDMIGELSIPPP